MSKLLKNYMSD